MNCSPVCLWVVLVVMIVTDGGCLVVVMIVTDGGWVVVVMIVIDGWWWFYIPWIHISWKRPPSLAEQRNSGTQPWFLLCLCLVSRWFRLAPAGVFLCSGLAGAMLRRGVGLSTQYVSARVVCVTRSPLVSMCYVEVLPTHHQYVSARVACVTLSPLVSGASSSFFFQEDP